MPRPIGDTAINGNRLEAAINYAARANFRQRYCANDHSRDMVVIDGATMALSDGRVHPPARAEEGFRLVPHRSRVGNFEDPAEVAALYPAEIVELLLSETGADEVIVTAPGILRFSAASGRAGSRDNSMPARFAQIDSTSETGAGFARRSLPEERTLGRYAHFNVWRAISAPPQDVPLAGIALYNPDDPARPGTRPRRRRKTGRASRRTAICR